MEAGIKIAIIDNGVDSKILHKLKDELVVDDTNKCKKDCLNSQTIDFGHGTICALIIKKYCPECEFSSIRILNRSGKGAIQKIEPALDWCYQNHIKLVNLSLGTTHFRDNLILSRLINRYANMGMIIVAALSNSGFYTYPAGFANVIGVATTDSPLPYSKDYMHLGIDTIVPSEHTVLIGHKEERTTLSNSYATSYVVALIARKISMDNNCNLYNLKDYVKRISHVDMISVLHNPDWVYKAYIQNRKNKSKANYYFEALTGNYEDIESDIDTVIAYSKAELCQIDIKNKHILYLGEENIENIQVSGFKWSWQTRVQQIINNQYQGKGLEIPLIILELADSLDKYFILTKFRDLFGNDGYNAYTVSMEPESVLYGIEYIPDIQMPMTNRLVANFIEGQVFYKQSDLILWNVSKGQKENIYSLYSDCDVKILVNEGEIFVYIEKNLIYKQVYSDLTEECIRTIYDVLVSCMVEETSE